jgi:hypothetical protein
MTFAEFHRGLVLALAATGESFVAEGPKFHHAYLAAAQGMGDFSSRLRLDPVFQTVREASEMLLEAMEDRTIELPLSSPQLVRFTVGRGQAMCDLQILGDVAAFLSAASTFLLTSKQSSPGRT